MTARWVRRLGAALTTTLLTGSLVWGGVAAAGEPLADGAGAGGVEADPAVVQEPAEPAAPAEPGVPEETLPIEAPPVESQPVEVPPVEVPLSAESVDDPTQEPTAGDETPASTAGGDTPADLVPTDAATPGDDKAVSDNVLPGASIIVNRVFTDVVAIDVSVYGENSGQASKSVEIVAPAPIGSTGVVSSSDPRLYADHTSDDGGLLPSGTYRIIITNLSSVSLRFTYEIGARAAQTQIAPVFPGPGAGLLVGADVTFGGEPLPAGASGTARVTGPTHEVTVLPLQRLAQDPERWQVHFGSIRLGAYVVHAEFTWPGSTASRVWSLDHDSSDVEAPPVVIETVPAASNPRGWFARQVTGFVSSADPGSGTRTVELRIDGGEWEVVEGTVIHFVLDHGVHTLEYRATDWAGNSTAVRTRTINVDTVAPTFESVVPVPGGEYELGSAHAVDVRCADDLSGVFECRTSAPAGNMLPTGTLGEQTLTVTVADRAGNFVQVPVTYTVVEKARPVVEASAPAPDGDAGWYRSAPPVTLTAAGGDVAGIRWQVAVDGGAPVDGGAAGDRATYTPTEDGVIAFTYWGVDGDDVAGEPQTLTLRVDSAGPVVQVRTPAGPFLLGAAVEADFVCTDETSGPVLCEGTVDAGELLPTGALGTHRLVVTATDAAGHRTESEFVYEVVAVLPPPASDDVPAAGRLPWTGAAPGAGIAVAAALLLAGAALLARRGAVRG